MDPKASEAEATALAGLAHVDGNIRVVGAAEIVEGEQDLTRFVRSSQWEQPIGRVPDTLAALAVRADTSFVVPDPAGSLTLEHALADRDRRGG
ncbi:hypothetical protein Ntsu_67920 [Nocardia sp. IFM 10818]